MVMVMVMVKVMVMMLMQDFEQGSTSDNASRMYWLFSDPLAGGPKSERS